MALQVIHVVRALQTGGLETLVLDVCARMRREGVDAGICALLPGDDLALGRENPVLKAATIIEEGRVLDDGITRFQGR